MNRIRERRTSLGITMKQLAEKIGVSTGAVSHYETGRREPDPDTLKRISAALGVSVDYLLINDNRLNPKSAAESAQAFQQLDPDRTRYADQLRAREHFGPSYQPPQPTPEDRSGQHDKKIEEAAKILRSMTDEEYAMALNILRAMKK